MFGLERRELATQQQRWHEVVFAYLKHASDQALRSAQQPAPHVEQTKSQDASLGGVRFE